MTLRPDETQKVKEIARQIAKEELEAMGKSLETKITDLETKVKELAAEMKRAKEVKPQIIDQSKKYK